MMKNDIEELAIKCGATIEQFTGNDNKKHDQICFECGTSELEVFVAALSQPQEAVGYTSAHLLTTVPDGDTGCFYKEKDDDEYNIALFTAPPNYEALLKDNERLREALKGLVDDLIMRANNLKQKDAIGVVACGNGAWIRANEALKKGQ